MAGLGFGSSKKLITPDGIAEGGIGWESLARMATDSLADAWFEELSPVPIRETLQKGAVDADQSVSNAWNLFAPFLNGVESTLAIPGLEISVSDLGEEIDLTEGQLGPALIATLADAGVTWAYDEMVPIDHERLMEVPGLQTVGVAQWGSYFGLPIEQSFRVFRDYKGNETCLWSANLLAATRPFEHLTGRSFHSSDTDDVYDFEISEDSIKRGALTFGQWSTKAFIPVLATQLFYLAETPFPSNVLRSFTRDIAFGSDFPANQRPKPVLINKTQSHARGAFDDKRGSYQTSGTLMPNVIEFGWTFGSTNQSEIRKILEVVTEGLRRMATILEDGYLNYRSDDFPFPYDDVLLSATKFDSDYVQGGSALGLSQWVPVQRLGFLLNETNIRFDQAVNMEKVSEQEWMAFDGAGFFVPHAINSLVYSTLILQKEWLTIDRLLDASVRMDVVEESTNSLCNWGLAKYRQGLIDEAIEKFEQALARSDKYSEAEASYWLSIIYEESGDTKKAQKYSARCVAAGGFEFVQNSQVAAPSLTKSKNAGLSISKLTNQAAFCSQCGLQFKEDHAKFCAGCGNAR